MKNLGRFFFLWQQTFGKHGKFIAQTYLAFMQRMTNKHLFCSYRVDKQIVEISTLLQYHCLDGLEYFMN